MKEDSYVRTLRRPGLRCSPLPAAAGHQYLAGTDRQRPHAGAADLALAFRSSSRSKGVGRAATQGRRRGRVECRRRAEGCSSARDCGPRPGPRRTLRAASLPGEQDGSDPGEICGGERICSQTRRELADAAVALMNHAATRRRALCPRLNRRGRALDDEPLEIEIATTLLYGACHYPYRQIRDLVAALDEARRSEIIAPGPRHRGRHDELLREFSSGHALRFDILMDIGGFRDMHRHRRCVQILQTFTNLHGYEIPALVADAGLVDQYRVAMDGAVAAFDALGRRAATPKPPMCCRWGSAPRALQDGLCRGPLYRGAALRRCRPLLLSPGCVADVSRGRQKASVTGILFPGGGHSRPGGPAAEVRRGRISGKPASRRGAQPICRRWGILFPAGNLPAFRPVL